jgi:predicted signal transduction protein with EAL and GGDEF domain
VARRVRACLREGDIAARLGGDELAVLLADGTDEHRTEAVAERILARLREPFVVEGRRITIGASIGIAAAGPGQCRAAELLRNADVAMYTAKTSGKNRYSLFEPRMHEMVLQRHDLKADLLRALERRELSVHYQPIVDLRTRRVAMVEALLRWEHPVRGMVEPKDFITVAEETGLLLQMGRWVLIEACRQARIWQEEHPAEPPLVVSVNVSGRQLEQPDFVEDLRRCLETARLDGQYLVVEVTESSMLSDPGAARQTLEGVRELGVRVAIDDFGTGYSSLAALRSLPVDILKLAKPFVDDLGEGPGQEAFAQAIVALAGSLGMVTVAEGIEHAHQAERLRSMGCELGQGYHFAMPDSAEQMLPTLTTRFPGVGQVLRLA